MESKLSLYKIEPNYLKYMHGIDHKVSVKYNNRPFVGIITMINGIRYVLPLTSQTTQQRKKEGKSKRSPLITTFIKDNTGNEIANILHNNMFPIKEGVYSLLEIDSTADTYELNEIRYIRKNTDTIIKKANKVNNDRKTKNNFFLYNTCCDFQKLEENYMNYIDDSQIL